MNKTKITKTVQTWKKFWVLYEITEQTNLFRMFNKYLFKSATNYLLFKKNNNTLLQQINAKNKINISVTMTMYASSNSCLVQQKYYFVYFT